MCTNNLRVEHFFPAVRDDGLLAVDLLPAAQDRASAVPADHAVADQFVLPDPHAFQLFV